jgi:hypothetical protein
MSIELRDVLSGENQAMPDDCAAIPVRSAWSLELRFTLASKGTMKQYS